MGKSVHDCLGCKKYDPVLASTINQPCALRDFADYQNICFSFEPVDKRVQVNQYIKKL